MGAQPKPRCGVASLARQDLPSRAAAMLTRAVCSLLCANFWLVVPTLPFYSPYSFASLLSLFSFTTGFGQCDSCKGPRFGVDFHSNRPSTDPSVGLRFGTTPLVPCPFAFQPDPDSVHDIAEQTLNGG